MDQAILHELVKNESEYHVQTLEKDVYEFISKRCERALLSNNNYLDLQIKLVTALKNNNMEEYRQISNEMLTITEITCYKSAIKDLILIFTDNVL